MKKIIYGLALAAVTLASCSDFLDKEPSNKLDAASSLPTRASWHSMPTDFM